MAYEKSITKCIIACIKKGRSQSGLGTRAVPFHWLKLLFPEGLCLSPYFKDVALVAECEAQEIRCGTETEAVS